MLRCAATICVFVLLAANCIEAQIVRLVPRNSEKRIDVEVGGRLFTSYRWDADLKKPILFPIFTSKGTVITRGFPLEPRAGESVDHPHQSGLWFNYGDVNGIDFWNNSVFRTANETKHMGTIVHRGILAIKGGKSSGELLVAADWLTPDEQIFMRETTKYVFRDRKGSRIIDRTTTLTAVSEEIVFEDSKEGMFGLRVRRELEQPTKEAIALTDADGKPGGEKVIDNKNVTGEFHNSEGKTGDGVWGTRARWSSLTGRVANEDITIVIFDNPKNFGFPAYCMARGYGLFAVNPLGRNAYENKEPLNYALAPRRSVTFRYRVLLSSRKNTPANIEAVYRDFVENVK